MDHDHKHYQEPENKGAWWKTSFGITAIFFFVIAGYFLFMEHKAHVVPYLSWLILLLCPLMHIFMHGGHGGHSHSDDEKKK